MIVLGPLPCIACHRIVVWWRNGRGWYLINWGRSGVHHCDVSKAA